jgi:GNAT superfamily N-acetyltransferase
VSAAVHIRDAVPGDLPLIERFIRGLAEFERLSHEVTATPALLEKALFKEKKASALICEVGGKPAGFCIWFYNFSTFLGRPGIYIEDVFVDPAFRSRGIGREVFKHLARRAVKEGCGRLEWAVLDWNEHAIRFYRSIGAVGMDEWRMQRVTGAALTRLAA